MDCLVESNPVTSLCGEGESAWFDRSVHELVGVLARACLPVWGTHASAWPATVAKQPPARH